MERRIVIEHAQNAAELFGSINGNMTVIEQLLSVNIDITEDGLVLNGEDSDISKAETVINRLIEMNRQGHAVNLQLVTYLADSARQGLMDQVASYSPDSVCVTAKGRPIRSKTLGQKNYVEAISKNDITFAIGPAGTGKTFLAVAMAVNAFRAQQVSRIILTRPAVEAGEKLGFLPGDLQTKVDPYMRPLYDALHELMGTDQYLKNLEKGLIEVSPLAYMRGRTLDEAFIILDEAQNTTPEQMKMFLTRLGFGSKAVVTGDITQIDLPRDKRSGLIEARRILQRVEGLSFVELTKRDVVRNPLVQRIIAAYEKAGMKGG
ncbi:MAG: PhoH family protein [Eubacteriales bacterium]|jgi:phosphate starvation-inducible PhoH-like protein|nr:PhoH family protein [Eubacteriales bacterium]MDD3197108.1 PhoH family protein [Eubacteriales bacterium]MDD3503299.1 PhoH family protein [Eubacteriales bacterium]MDD4681584.1 PhoH family protein [Eubacteriales bacterium]